MLKNLQRLFRMRKKRIFIIAAIVFLVVFGRLFFEGLKLSPVFFQFLFSREIELKKTDERMGVLILGVGGERHEGPLLTDTIIYASIDPAKKKIALLSLPRDFWVPDLKAKINTAYAYGEGKRKGGGIILSKAVVEKVLAQPVDYVVRVDFKGFVKAIDMLGGIEVDVEREFDDYEYPVAGKETDACGFEGEEFEKRATASAALEAFPCRYMHLRFEKGRQPMDGETALRFVRSRHAIGVEGTDFARSKRQEKVIEAVKTKLFSLGTFLNPFKLTSLYDIFRDSIDTDIKQSEYDDFIRLFQKIKDAQIKSIVFFFTSKDSEESALLINPPTSDEYEGQWVLIPKAGNGNFSEVQKYVECEMENEDCKINSSPTP